MRLGSLVHLSVANQHFALISSQELAMELLEGTNSADRPQFVMAGELSVISPRRPISVLTFLLHIIKDGVRRIDCIH